LPKQTFFNLPAEKRERITQVALDEFSNNSYHRSSINRIVENANISKGSFYQYFSNKKDLYRYLIDKAGEEKIKFLQKEIVDYDKLEFFPFLRKLFLAGIKFNQSSPYYDKLVDRIYRSESEQFKEEIIGESKYKSNDFLIGYVKKAREQGELKEELNPEMIAFLITELSVSIVDYYFKMKDPTEDLEGMMEIVDDMLEILKSGISEDNS